MKILIQLQSSGAFWTQNQTWSNDPAEAMAFNTASEALQYGRRHRLTGAQVVLSFTDKAIEVVAAIEEN